MMPFVLATTQFWKHFSGGMPSVLVDNKKYVLSVGNLQWYLPLPRLPTETDTTNSVTYISRSVSVA